MGHRGHSAYDIWNRLVDVKNGSTSLVAYQYDALNRRIKEDRAGTATDHELYYSADWQVLEERQMVTGPAQAQYVWSAGYVDALVRRDRDATGGPALEEVLYVQQDANHNVTALVNPSGTVQERYAYDPYGPVTILSLTWMALGSSAYSWVYLHQGGRFEAVSALYHFRYRDLSPTRGRWMRRDPIEYKARDILPPFGFFRRIAAASSREAPDQ